MRVQGAAVENAEHDREMNIGAQNKGPDNTGTDLQGWKTRDLTTREPIAR